MNTSKHFFLASIIACIAIAISSCSTNKDGNTPKVEYGIIQIDGTSYACYGYGCPITFTSYWNYDTHKGEITLPCGKLSDAQQGVYNYDYAYTIKLSGTEDLAKGSKLENFSPTLTDAGGWYTLDYTSGSAVVTEIVPNKYITINFSNFYFTKGTTTHSFTGTVQRALSEKYSN